MAPDQAPRGRLTLLLLGGTAEARELDRSLHGEAGAPRVVTSHAGVVRDTPRPAGERRTGGFGGVDGLVAWLRAHAPVAVVDATHPFAARITRHAVEACARTGTPLLRLERPGWVETPGDVWHRVPDLEAAARLVPELGERPFLALGRGGLVAYLRHLEDVAGAVHLARCVEPPAGPVPPGTTLLLDRGPYDVAAETDLLLRHRVDVLVTKDSGGQGAGAKLDAARDLGIPVVMVDRPAGIRPLQDVIPGTGRASGVPVPVVATVADALGWVLEHRVVG